MGWLGSRRIYLVISIVKYDHIKESLIFKVFHGLCGLLLLLHLNFKLLVILSRSQDSEIAYSGETFYVISV
jgi:hypothetical protein